MIFILFFLLIYQNIMATPPASADEIRAPKLYNVSRFTNIINGLGLAAVGLVNVLMGTALEATGINKMKDLVLVRISFCV